MLEVFYVLVLSHLVADFYCQSDAFCAAKESKGFCAWQQYVHALVVMGCAWLMVGHVAFWWGALLIGVSHLILDGLKHYVRERKGVFFIDQALHIAILVLVAYLFREQSSELLAAWGWETKYAVYAIGILLIGKPANVIIQKIFQMFDLQIPTSAQSEEGSRSLLQAGHVIGVAERVMAFVFVLVQQYEALGFLIAAKSILRFGDKETARTEYVLVGTLLSYMIAVLSALCVGWLV
jgi:hypothetical protein